MEPTNEATAAAPASSPGPAESRSRPRPDLTTALILAAVAIAVFVNAFGGAFVYDDRKQIADNHLIQESRYLGEALTSDVWAFKGEQPEAWSNYWRPVFVLWLAGCYRLFGLQSTVGWHLANALLHALVVVLAYLLLRRLALPRAPATAATLLFAVHPAHVESVAWISGSPDLLLAAALLGSLLCVLAAVERAGPPLAVRWGPFAAALGLYAVALGAKEAAITFPLLAAVVVFARPAVGAGAAGAAATGVGATREGGGADAGGDGGGAGTSADGGASAARLRQAAAVALPFILLAAVYLVVRWRVLGRVEITVPWHMGPWALAANAPRLLLFYLRQAAFPLWIGPSYPLRALAPGEWGSGFWLPLAVEVALAAAVILLARRERRMWIAAAFFLLPLAPAFNLNAFLPEHLVHDRYLYLPLLGFALAAVLALDRLLALLPLDLLDVGRRRAAVLAAAVLAAVPLAAQTVAYNRAWTGELALWERAVASDPTSSYNLAEYGRALYEAKRLPEAKAAVDRALAIAPVTTALLVRADLAREEGRLPAAAADLENILAHQPDNPLAYQRLAVVYQRQGKLAQAASLLRAARERVPYRRCAFTDDLAVVLYLAGAKDQALAELEAARPAMAAEPTAGCARVLFHLGALYAERNRAEDARNSFAAYLGASSRFRDEVTAEFRAKAGRALGG